MRHKKKQALLWGACFFFLPVLRAQATFHLDTLEGRSVLVVSPPPDSRFTPAGNEAHPGALKVYAGDKPDSGDVARLSMAGTVSMEGKNLIFRPALPFRRGLLYWALVPGEEPHPFSLPAEASGAVPEVVAVKPSADTLPSNQLKFYFFFNVPMSEGEAYERVRMLDASGKEVSEPFVPLRPELWDAGRRRLTLWLNPGRVKRELGPNQAEGEILSAGKRYTLEVGAGWDSAAGGTTQGAYRKEFVAGPADRDKPVVEQWQLGLPAAASREGLIVQFGEPLDAVLAVEAISVWHDYEKVSGKVDLTDGDRRWVFIPEGNWEKGEYLLRAEARLEDLASNNLQRVFDVDLRDGREEVEERAYFTREFRLE